MALGCFYECLWGSSGWSLKQRIENGIDRQCGVHPSAISFDLLWKRQIKSSANWWNFSWPNTWPRSEDDHLQWLLSIVLKLIGNRWVMITQGLQPHTDFYAAQLFSLLGGSLPQQYGSWAKLAFTKTRYLSTSDCTGWVARGFDLDNCWGKDNYVSLPKYPEHVQLHSEDLQNLNDWPIHIRLYHPVSLSFWHKIYRPESNNFWIWLFPLYW